MWKVGLNAKVLWKGRIECILSRLTNMSYFVVLTQGNFKQNFNTLSNFVAPQGYIASTLPSTHTNTQIKENKKKQTRPTCQTVSDWSSKMVLHSFWPISRIVRSTHILSLIWYQNQVLSLLLFEMWTLVYKAFLWKCHFMKSSL